jgi:predicted phage terminase large subunit-like protein
LAFVDGKWLDRPARERLINEIREENKLIRRLIETNKAVDYDLDRLEANLTLLEKLERVHRAEYDFLYFMHEYFSEERNPGNPDNLIPAGITYESAAEFHRELCSLLDDITKGVDTRHKAWCTARGTAKTAYTSNGYVCHQVVYRLRRYIVVCSETTDMAGDFISWTANQLRLNEKLREDFGVLLHTKKSMNEVDNKYEFVTLSGTKVEAKGTGTQVRGMRHGNSRPDLYILDDLESRDNTNTTELIEKSKRWFREELMPALAQNGVCIYIGTIVAYNCLLDYVIKERKDFVSRKFPAIISWSERPDLWAEWERIYREDSPDAVERADTFYKENEDEMIRGTKVLWHERYSYLDLMKIKVEAGSKAFSQEFMGNPIDTETQVFPLEMFTYFTESDLIGKPLRYYCGVDMALGKERGDYSAIITIAKNVDTGVCYVVDAFIERCKPDTLIKEVVNLAQKYQYEVIAVEAQMAQEFFAEKLAEDLLRNGYPANTRLKQIKQRMRKQLRIESLAPDIQSGKLRFRKEHSLLLEQFELYDGGKRVNDDGPDAVHMAYTAAKTPNRVITTSAKRLR